MNANELMIGDWVYAKVQVDDTGTEPVYETIPKRVSELSRGINGIYTEDTSTFAGAEILPIPLTFEIMEKNGFVKVPYEYEYPDCQCWTNDVDGIYSFEIVADEHRKPYILGNGDMGDYEWVNFECKYVHELQHALRLAGIKKEIVL